MTKAFQTDTFQNDAFQVLNTVSVSGALTFVGTVVKAIYLQHGFTGALTFVSTTIRKTLKPLSGAITFAGSLARRIGKILSGAITFVGDIIRRRIVPVDIVLVVAPSVGVVVDGAPADDITIDIDPTYGVVFDKI